MSPPEVEAVLTEDSLAARVRNNPGYAWLVLAIVAALLLGLVSAWRQGWFTPTAHVYVNLPGAGGLQVGTPVKVKGFKIGEVDEVVLEESLNVRARLRLASAKMALLGADATARFGRDGPIGGKYIDVLPGSRQGRRLAAEQTLVMDAGNDIEDVMATVKVAVEKLTLALDKLNPILDDTHKLTGDAAAMRETLRSSLTQTLANVQSMSGELRQTGARARTLVGHIDDDRAKVVADVRKVLGQADAATASASASLKTVEGELPLTLEMAKGLLLNARDSSADVKHMLHAARGDVPEIVRSGRAAAQDAADISQGLKNTWPISATLRPSGADPLPLDGFEASPP